MGFEIGSLSSKKSMNSFFVFIRPTQGWRSLNLWELWEYRELLYFFSWKEIKVRYKQTIFGAAWAIIQPLFTMVVFSVFFGKLGKIPSDGIPYPIFSFAALVPWHFFANGLGNSANSLVGSANLIKKVYFPRLIMPISGVVSGLIDFSINLFLLLVLMAIYGFYPTINFIWLPGLALLAFITSLGSGLFLSALNVQFRDVRYILSFLIQFWLFVTPIAYPSSLIPGNWRLLYALNPMTGVVEGFRWALLGKSSANPGMMIVSCVVSFSLLLGGLYYFRRMEKNFADIV